MKIDTTAPRLPINRLKHPLREKLTPAKDDGIAHTEPESAFVEVFERQVISEEGKAVSNVAGGACR